MPKKTMTSVKFTAILQTVKFAKGDLYQDLGGDLSFCTDAKQKKVSDQQGVMMRRIKEGKRSGTLTRN